VFFGRLLPGIRSIISLPAGASRMSLPLFSAFTLAGSAIWNSLLLGLGAFLGTQHELVERYSRYLNYIVIAAVVGLIAGLIVRRIRRTRRRRMGQSNTHRIPPSSP